MRVCRGWAFGKKKRPGEEEKMYESAEGESLKGIIMKIVSSEVKDLDLMVYRFFLPSYKKRNSEW